MAIVALVPLRIAAVMVLARATDLAEVAVVHAPLTPLTSVTMGTVTLPPIAEAAPVRPMLPTCAMTGIVIPPPIAEADRALQTPLTFVTTGIVIRVPIVAAARVPLTPHICAMMGIVTPLPIVQGHLVPPRRPTCVVTVIATHRLTVAAVALVQALRAAILAILCFVVIAMGTVVLLTTPTAPTIVVVAPGLPLVQAAAKPATLRAVIRIVLPRLPLVVHPLVIRNIPARLVQRANQMGRAQVVEPLRVVKRSEQHRRVAAEIPVVVRTHVFQMRIVQVVVAIVAFALCPAFVAVKALSLLIAPEHQPPPPRTPHQMAAIPFQDQAQQQILAEATRIRATVVTMAGVRSSLSTREIINHGALV